MRRIAEALIGPMVVLTILGAWVWSIGHPPDRPRIEHARRGRAQQITESIEYLKDERTGLCFAHLWEGAGNGGPALATVPCDAVVRFLR